MREKWLTATAIVAVAMPCILPGALAAVPPVARGTTPVMQAEQAVAGIDWVRVPAGTLQVEEAPNAFTRVLKAPLVISSAPITCRQYARFLRATGRAAPVFPIGDSFIRFIRPLAPSFTWNGATPPPGYDDWPVAFISQDDAQAYCRWLTEQTGHRYRLPRRAELEYCLTWPVRGPKDFGEFPRWHDPKWLGDFVAWYGLGPVGAQGAGWGKPTRSRFNLRHYPQTLYEWTADDSVVCEGAWSMAGGKQTYNYSMHASGEELHVFGLRIVAEDKP